MLAAKVGLLLAGLGFATTTLEKVGGTLGLIAGIIVSVGVIFAGSRAVWRVMSKLESMVENTAALPQFMADQRATNEQVHARLTQENEKVQARLDAGSERMARIEASLDTWATAERAAVDAAIAASTAPRPPRSTDPTTSRTGWRE